MRSNKREILVKAYIDTANKYLAPLNQTFFDNDTCPVCIAINHSCAICPSNLSETDTIGCISHSNYRKLISDTDSGYFDKEAPTEAMVARAAQLLEASLFIEKELTDQELRNNDFTRVYPLLS